ncbi:MAG: GNAT family N-acetyltransferase [Anaerolineales bacterium]
MLIRPAAHADLPAIIEIYNWAVLNTTATAAYEPEPLEQRATWFESHQRDGYPVFVAEAEAGQVVGWSSLSKYKERIGYRFTAENSIYLAPDVHGRGIGKLLMTPLIEAARELGLHAIVAGIDSENVASLKLHARFGFVEVARFREVGFKFGQWLDVVYMELVLG